MSSRDPNNDPKRRSDPDKRLADRQKHVEERLAKKQAQISARFDRARDKLAKKGLDPSIIDSAMKDVMSAFDKAGVSPRQPRLSREDIVRKAIEIADAEGIDAVSMRRLAQDLDVGTMTLYHYVATKDELMVLMSDDLVGELLLKEDESMPEDWRAGLSLIANNTRRLVEKHGWLFDIQDDAQLGPNAMLHFDQSLQAVDSLDIPFRTKFEIVSVVDEYVFGYCFSKRNDTDDHFQDGDARKYAESMMKTHSYPAMEKLAQTMSNDELWTEMDAAHSDPERFDRNLKRLLDGIAAELDV